MRRRRVEVEQTKKKKKRMRTLCDVCERAAAILFCAADEAALCSSCDEKVHMCNKLASRHVRVGLADPSDVPRCDICESGPGDKSGHLVEVGMQPLDPHDVRREQIQRPKLNQQNHRTSPVPALENDIDGDVKMDIKLIDLNTRPSRIHGQPSTNQEQGMDVLSGTNRESTSVVPIVSFEREPEK
ncbi:putative salt tolerance-like protein [Morus notabilis]|uniref:Putative salt tolerance-like protein n=1 Tax=Morus notabilis TaxID=981085 RepID=W9QGY6_9ROSA|nr:putative salt tolerance-like protein [Morus notabilis]